MSGLVQCPLGRQRVKVLTGGEQRRPGVFEVGLDQADPSVPHQPDGGRDAARVPGGRGPGERGAEYVVEAGNVDIIGETGEHGVHGPAKTLTRWG